MGLTQLGQDRQDYTEQVRRMPYSRFTQDPTELAANQEWREEVDAWAAQNKENK